MKKVLLLSSLFIYTVLNAGNVNSVVNGNWTLGSTWNTGSTPNTGADAISVGNNVVVNTNVALSGSASLSVTGTLIDPTGGVAYALSLSNSSFLTVSGNTKFEGSLAALNNATITVNANDTLTVGSASFINNTVLIINTGGVMIINGNLNISNNNGTTINGKIIVNGNVTGSNNATISGTGGLSATGTISTSGGSTIFGGSGSCTSCSVSSSAPLPVELMYFHATAYGNKIQFDWATATETNNNYFSVERSVEGKAWTEVARKNGAGNSIQTLMYSAFDLSPIAGTSYYRLKQVDKNGASKYFSVIEVTLIKKYFTEVYPNPTLNEFTVKVRGSSKMLLTDALGKEIVLANLNEGENQVDVSGLKAGIYFLNVMSDSENDRIKILVQK